VDACGRRREQRLVEAARQHVPGVRPPAGRDRRCCPPPRARRHRREPRPRLAARRVRARGVASKDLTETVATAPLELAGLTEAEARRRLAERGPVLPPATSRSTATIVRANVFTVFNAILLGLGILTLAYGDWRDALFLGIIVANSGIGIAQELRAKKALDRLAALVAPHANVVRDGHARRVPVEDVVVGDLVRLDAGDQVVADGTLVRSEGLTLDESILTGESRPVSRPEGEEIRSGSFAAEGAGFYEVTAVGDDSYAQRIAGEAREFRHPRSPLERALNRLLFLMVAMMIPLAAIFIYSLSQRDDDTIDETVTSAVAGIVTLVPEGLILLASLTYAAASLYMTRRGALAQQLNAIESLASVDLICLDKTGTLTEPTLRVVDLQPAPGVEREQLALELSRYAASSPSSNATLKAIGEAHPGAADVVAEQVPFSSRRRWSGLRLGTTGYVLGAPELFALGLLGGAAEREQAGGRRVLAFGRTDSPFDSDGEPPDSFDPLGIVVLSEQLRPEARRTVEFFAAEGVELKIISGDAPETVAAIAADAGIPSSGPPVDGRRLPASDAELRELVLAASVVGRISPEDKKRVVEVLTASGRYVAMVGDGVNDVPALKAARLAVAQGSGSEMARSVADVVLVSGDFAAVPAMVEQGRKILRNIQRVAKLFVTKSAFAAFLIFSVGISETAYPLLPRHLTLAAALTIGIPGFFLALAPSHGDWRTTGFLREVSRFAFPAGVAAGLGVIAAYHFALNVATVPLTEARTVATAVLVLVGLYLILVLEASGRRRGLLVTVMCAVMLAIFVFTLVVGGLRSFFELDVPGFWSSAAILVGTGLTVGFLWLTDARFVPDLSFLTALVARRRP
jgi:cation-transporting ATPase E/undecaprenyl-diphosphatase